MKLVLSIVTALAAGVAIGWAGLRFKPKAFAAYPEQTAVLQTVPLPDDLPAPVARWYRGLYGSNISVITTAVVTGRGTIAPFGIALPARFRFTYEAGQGYRHYIEATFFGLPIMKVNEWFLDGHGRLDLPILGRTEGPHTDQGANLGLWAESTLMPAVLLTDSRVRWQAVDEQTALLFVPFGDEQEQFVARFDPESGRLLVLEAMRYRDEAGGKILWLPATVPGPTIKAGGATLDAAGSATWLDQGKPWLTFVAEEIVYNVDVQEYIRDSGI